MDSFTDATDVLESLQPSDHLSDHLAPRQDSTTGAFSLDMHNSFSNDSMSYSTSNNTYGLDQSGMDKYKQFGEDKPRANYNATANNETITNGQADFTQAPIDKSLDKSQLLTIIHFLKKHNFQATEEILMKETSNFISEDDVKSLLNSNLSESNFSSFVYRSEGNPDVYEDNYRQLQRFVEASLDSYRHELCKLLYPVFVHMYLELVCNDHEERAICFMKKFGKQQEFVYTDDINKLSLVTKRDHFSMYNDVLQNFRNSQQLFTIRLSRDSHNYLKRFLQEKSQSGQASILLNVIQEHLTIEAYDGLTRSKTNVEAVSGAMFGEVNQELNRNRVFYGLLKEPELKIEMLDIDIDIDGSSQQNADAAADSSAVMSAKKKKIKKDSSQAKKARSDPNAPPITRIPLPELRDAEQLEKIRARKEASKALKLGNEVLPSICLYTLLNAQPVHEMSAICAEISDDSTLLAVGFSDSLIRVWSLTPTKLRGLKTVSELENLDKESDDVSFKMLTDQNTDLKVLYGHSGPVYGMSFSACKDLLLSCSEDATIRLWSLLTWTNVVVYKGHCFPVWDVKFSPHGYYFASCSHDRTARLWATDNHNPLRYFAGHYSDVDCLQFHPNSNYIATGSSDRSIRFWDCLNGQCVRHLTGHKGNIHALAFENSGRFLASAGVDKRILLWDIASGHLVAELSNGHNSTIYSLAFNRGPDSIILASGGLDNRVVLWNMQALLEDTDMDELMSSTMPTIKSKSEAYMLASYPTKSTYILLNHFTRRNLLLSIGAFK